MLKNVARVRRSAGSPQKPVGQERCYNIEVSIVFRSRSVPLREIAYVGVEAISDGRFTHFKDLGADQPVFSHR